MRPTIEKDGSVVWKVLAGGPPSRDLTSSQAAAVRSSDPRGAASVGLSYPKRLVAPSFYRSKPGEDLGKLQVAGGPTRGELEARALVLLAVVATALKGFLSVEVKLLSSFCSVLAADVTVCTKGQATWLLFGNKQPCAVDMVPGPTRMRPLLA